MSSKGFEDRDGGPIAWREAAVAAATGRGTAALVAKRPEPPGDLKLYTGLRPLENETVRDLVRAAADDALGCMAGVQSKVTGP